MNSHLDMYRRSYQAWDEAVAVRASGLVERANERDLNGTHAFLDSFIPVFLRCLPLGFARQLADDSLLDFILRRYEFVGDYDGSVKLSVEKCLPEENARGKVVTAVEVLTDDMPYIISTMRMLLARAGREVLVMAHPVFRTGRPDGRLDSLADAGREDGGHEAYVYMQVTPGTDEEDEEVRKMLLDGIACLRVVSEDTPGMRGLLEGLGERDDAFRGGTYPDEGGGEEVAAFVRFLLDDNYTLLGASTLDLSDSNKMRWQGGLLNQVSIVPGLEGALERPVEAALSTLEPMQTYKLALQAPILSSSPLDLVALVEFDTSGDPVRAHLLLGLWSSGIQDEKIRKIPVFRTKSQWALREMSVLEGSYVHRRAHLVLNTLPKEKVFQASRADLRDELMFTLTGLEEQGVSVMSQPLARELGMGFTAMVPFRTFRAEQCESALGCVRALFPDDVTRHHVVVDTLGMTRAYFLVYADVAEVSQAEIARLEHEIFECFETIETKVARELERLEPRGHGESTLSDFLAALPASYRASHDVASIIVDLHWLDELREVPDGVRADFRLADTDGDDFFILKLYSRTRLELSRVLPVLDFMRLGVVDEQTTAVTPPDTGASFYIHEFRTHPPRVGRGNPYTVLSEGDVTEIEAEGEQQGTSGPRADRTRLSRMAAAVVRILDGQAEKDRLFGLTVTAGLDWNEISLFVAMRNYLFQLTRAHSRLALNRALVENGAVARLLMDYMRARLDPEFSEKREARSTHARRRMIRALSSVDRVGEDRILRRFLDLADALVRTNFFGRGIEDPIVLKFRSDRMTDTERNTPLIETFVYHPDVEGIHLRMALVARGGIRWSDRRDDYRSEVLGLVRTQHVKNSVIVPAGAKGGFLVKGPAPEGMTREDHGRECYKLFIRGLLSITDNVEEDGIVHPPGLVILDGDDPYFVVAADKGTATFSDTANEISAEFGFWLGDAFASGGSRGYNHKDLAITARGAWESVRRHFWEEGLDPDRDEFTVIGIGDMSGDVFGNGMLLSRKMKLRGAFNHRHVFLDPDPDPEASWIERKRLFGLPRSGWDDYDLSLVSEGGGVFDRNTKSIPLSASVREMLGVEEEALSGDELIHCMLKMDVDLLWNGGIGTYVRADGESHLDVGDKMNDGTRVKASEVRARVIGEGGNLGATQAARIQLALRGVRLNTDAVDNSGGVDCSDHEVNLKILLDSLVAKGDVSEDERNQLLAEVTDEVVELVLKNNFLQTEAISLEQRRSRARVDEYRDVVDLLDERGQWSRLHEDASAADSVMELWDPRMGLPRPLLCNLLGFAKNRIAEHLLDADFVDEPLLVNEVMSHYFPEALMARLGDRGHRLQREISATMWANKVLNEMGATFFYRVALETSRSVPEIARAYLFANAMFNGVELRERLRGSGQSIPSEIVYEVLGRLGRITEESTRWILASQRSFDVPFQEVFSYRERLAELQVSVEQIVTEEERTKLEGPVDRLVDHGVSEPDARMLTLLDFLAQPVSVLHISEEMGVGITRATEAYLRIGDALGFVGLIARLDVFDPGSDWDRIAKDSLRSRLLRLQERLASRALHEATDGEGDVRATVIDPFLQSRRRGLRGYAEKVDAVCGDEVDSLVPMYVIRDMLENLVR